MLAHELTHTIQQRGGRLARVAGGTKYDAPRLEWRPENYADYNPAWQPALTGSGRLQRQTAGPTVEPAPRPAPEPTLVDILKGCMVDLGLGGLISRVAAILMCLLAWAGGPGGFVLCLKIVGIILAVDTVAALIRCFADRRAAGRPS